MKKIDVEKFISDWIKENPISLNDNLKKRKEFKNLTEYKLFLESNFKIYNHNIEYYANIINDEITRLNNCITSLMEYEDEENLKRNIGNAIRNKLGLDYNRSKNLSCIFVDSLNDNLPYKSFVAFKFIYDNYNIEGLNLYIKLLTSSSNVTSYMNSSDENEREISFVYMGFRIGENNYTTLARKALSKAQIEKLTSAYSQAISTIEEEKQEYVKYMTEIKEEEKLWFEESKDNYNEFSNDAKYQFNEFVIEANQKLEKIEKTYAEKLKVVKPAQHMESEANKYKEEVKKYSYIVGGIVFFVIMLLYFIITPKIEFGNKTILEINLFSKQIPIYSSLIILSIISIALYFLRIFIKLLMSSKHLETEYKQKYALTYFYLSLINNGNLTDEEVNNKILALLFSSADTGLIKGDTSSSDIEKILFAVMGSKSNN